MATPMAQMTLRAIPGLLLKLNFHENVTTVASIRISQRPRESRKRLSSGFDLRVAISPIETPANSKNAGAQMLVINRDR